MSRLGRRWAGNVFGTNTGNVFVELEGEDAALTGTLRLFDTNFGLAIFKISGAFEGEMLRLTGRAGAEPPPGVELGQLTIVGKLTVEGSLRGDWHSALGTAGTFVLHPHDSLAVGQQSGGPPEQLHTAVRRLGAIHLYAEDVAELIRAMSLDFRAPRPAVAYRLHGAEIVKYADEFLREADPRQTYRYLRIGLGEPEAHGLNRNVMVEINADGFNQVVVQGVQQAWVLGKVQLLEDHLSRNRKTLISSFRRIGLNIPTVGFLLVLSVLPDLPVEKRLLFLAIAASCMWAVWGLNRRYLPTALVYLGPRKPSLLTRIWPQVLSAFIAAVFAFIAAIAYGLLKGEIKLPEPPWG